MLVTKNFDIQLVDLDGEVLVEPQANAEGQLVEQPVPPVNKLIARALQNYATIEGDDPVELFTWALLIHKGGDVELDRTAYTKITAIIRKTYTNVLVQAQIIKLLDA